MPAGIDSPELGGLAFGVIKLSGYCFAAYMMSRHYRKPNSHWFVIGLTRTLIGVAFGYPYYSWITSSSHSVWFMAGLIPIRMVEWLLLIFMFYDRRLQNRLQAFSVAAAGTAWSFVLDLPATIGFILVGGFWIC